MQIVQDLPPPFPLDLPMVLIKPREACSTAEVYKVINWNWLMDILILEAFQDFVTYAFIF